MVKISQVHALRESVAKIDNILIFLDITFNLLL